MTILSVGEGQTYGTIAGAVAVSHDGDVIQVQAGNYVNDFATVNTKITIEGVGGMAHQPEQRLLLEGGDIHRVELPRAVLRESDEAEVGHLAGEGVAG